jgi:hypothetical protein
LIIRYAGRTLGLTDLVEFLLKIKQDMTNWHEGLSSLIDVNCASTDKIYHPAVLQLQYATLPRKFTYMFGTDNDQHAILCHPHLSVPTISLLPNRFTNINIRQSRKQSSHVERAQ